MFARRLLELCWKFGGSCKHPITRGLTCQISEIAVAGTLFDVIFFEMLKNADAIRSLIGLVLISRRHRL